MRFLYIVDDDRVARASMHTIAGSDPNIVIRAFASGVDFLKEAGDLDPGALLLDLNMPEVDGTQVLEELAARGGHHFATILVTAGASVWSAVQAMKLGAVDVVEKPCDRAALEEALSVAFGRLEAGIAVSSVARDAKKRIDDLTPREREVMSHLFDGKPNKATAFDLGISPRTVEVYRASAMRKLNVQNLASAVRLAVVAGWEPLREGRPGWPEAAMPMAASRRTHA